MDQEEIFARLAKAHGLSPDELPKTDNVYPADCMEMITELTEAELDFEKIATYSFAIGLYLLSVAIRENRLDQLEASNSVASFVKVLESFQKREDSANVEQVKGEDV